MGRESIDGHNKILGNNVPGRNCTGGRGELIREDYGLVPRRGRGRGEAAV